MNLREAVFIVPAKWSKKYKSHFFLLGERLTEGSAKGKLIPPMGKREPLKLFGKEIPIKESWRRRAIRELYEETSGMIKTQNVEYVGDIIDKTYEPDAEWHIRIYTTLNPQFREERKGKNTELKIMGWYDERLIDNLRETNQLNETTYKALKMVANHLKNMTN